MGYLKWAVPRWSWYSLLDPPPRDFNQITVRTQCKKFMKLRHFSNELSRNVANTVNELPGNIAQAVNKLPLNIA